MRHQKGRLSVGLRVAVLALALLGLARAQESRPNIVVIISDDMGYSDVSCYGGEIATPNIDSLAVGGLRYTNYYVNNMCTVTRASLMTGNYPHVARPRGVLSERCVTAPELLRRAGYTTLMVGKWHLGNRQRDGEGSPGDRGFDHWYGIPGGAASFFDPDLLTRDGADVSGEARTDPDYYFTDALSDEATRMVTEALDHDAERPFFLYMAYTAAHWPLHARESDIAKHRGAFADGWDVLRERRHAKMLSSGIIDQRFKLSPRHPLVPAWEDVEHPAWQQRRMEVYAAQITVMDEGIGRLIKLLKEREVLDDTLILYMHDNGACHVEYGKNRKGSFLPEKTRDGRPMRPGNLPEIMPGPEDTYQSVGYGWANLGNTPFRLFKQHDHEGGDRSPLIAHWPTRIRANQRGQLDRTVCHVTDILPTLLDAANLGYPSMLDGKKILPYVGRSIMPTFRGKAVANRNTIFWKNAKGRAIRDGDWKLVRQGNKSWELYNLAIDPTELNDLSGSKPARTKAMSATWRQIDWH